MHKLQRTLLVVVGTLWIAFYAYGFVRFPDAPLHACQSHGYCGKLGNSRTLVDFQAFSAWQLAFNVALVFGGLAIVGYTVRRWFRS